MRYKDVINNLRDLYMKRCISRLVLQERELIASGAKPELYEDYVKSEMAVKLANELDKVTRKSVVENPDSGAVIYENDIFVMLDPSGFFAQLEKELEGAYQHGLENGRRQEQREQHNRSPYGS